ncbi:sialidase family protein [Clostridium sp. AM58-1XD]|uniref:sialidase family protein n=1 Tax=Clostridium sp. AM58-1XD TaxID=2292307 RepID=UPI001A9A3212|nr:sialidase family protein [Clostridium sp. AM58-1XD]
MAVWFAGSKEGSDDVAIWGVRKENDHWTRPEKLAHDIEEPHWNPVLYQDPDGELLLFYKTGREISRWFTKIRRSEDGGKTFGQAEELVKGDRGGRGPVRCKIILLSDGSMLAGTSKESGIWTAYADRSEDKGKTWTLSNPVMIDVEYHGEHTARDSGIEVSEQSFFGRGVIQPTLWESEAGQVHMLLRSSEGNIYRADSMDYGRTWGKAYDTGLPNNNSGIDVVKCPDGLLVLCMNPVGENWGPRTPLVLMTSADNGNTWKQEAVLEDGEGEYSYPSIAAKEEQIYVTYTYDRKSIAFWQFNRKEIQGA